MSPWYDHAELLAMGVRAHETARVSRGAQLLGPVDLVVGAHSRIDFGALIFGRVTIGRHVHVAPYVVLHGKHGIVLGDFTGLSCGVTVYSESDDFKAGLVGPCVPEHFRARPDTGLVSIERGCVVGAGSVILPGAVLREGATVGSLSLVPAGAMLMPWTVNAGTPIRVIGKRANDKAQSAMEALTP